MTTGTEIQIALPDANQLSTMLKAENGLDATLASLKAAAEAKAANADVNTPKGRELMKSAAYDISKSKAEIVKRGKELTEEARREVALINSGIKAAETFLDEVRDQIKAPAVEWEANDAARKKRVADQLAYIRDHGMNAGHTSEEIEAKILEIEAVEFGADFAPVVLEAEITRNTALAALNALRDAAAERERQMAELEALRAEKAERDRIEAERIAKEKAEQYKREQAELAEAARLMEEARKAKEAELIEAERKAAAEKARIEAERAAKEKAERAKRAAQAREEELKRQVAAAEEKAKAAAQAERDRIAAEAKAEEEAREKRKADASRRQFLKNIIASAIEEIGAQTPHEIADALIDGKIPYCTVKI